jgi:hypothetical protein
MYQSLYQPVDETGEKEALQKIFDLVTSQLEIRNGHIERNYRESMIATYTDIELSDMHDVVIKHMGIMLSVQMALCSHFEKCEVQEEPEEEDGDVWVHVLTDTETADDLICYREVYRGICDELNNRGLETAYIA